MGSSKTPTGLPNDKPSGRPVISTELSTQTATFALVAYASLAFELNRRDAATFVRGEGAPARGAR